MNIGYKLAKPVSPHTYADAADWCNKNGAKLEDKGGYLEIVAVPVVLTVKDYENAVQKYLDETAQAKEYDNTYTCLSYLSSTNTTWKAEAETFNAFRDAVWLKCHELLAAWQTSGVQPSIADVIAALPVIVWPTTTP